MSKALPSKPYPALVRLAKATALEGDAKAKAQKAKSNRDALALTCAEGGASQREIAAVMNVTIDRVTQVLRQQRDLRHA